MSTKDPDHLKFLFEGSEDFCVLPSYGVIPAFQALGGLTQAEGIDIDPTKVRVRLLLLLLWLLLLLTWSLLLFDVNVKLNLSSFIQSVALTQTSE